MIFFRSKTDFKNGFHHIQIAEDSIKFTSFVTHRGQFDYLKLPFGLCNGPSAFSRFISMVFHKLIISNEVQVYFDDILIATETILKHFDILARVLKTIKENCLELNLAKCVFMEESVKYLRYVVSDKGISTNPDHVEALWNFPIPKDAHQVKRFLGLLVFSKKFIEGVSTISKQLSDLTKKGKNFEFGPLQLNAFETLKIKLISAPVLALYSPTANTELHTDASSCNMSWGLGW